MRRLLAVSIALCAPAACGGVPTASPPTFGGGDYCISQPGQEAIRTLASKRTRYGWQIGCTGAWQFETLYEFRSTEGYVCYVDMDRYFAYNVGDDAECGWYAG